MPMTQRDWDCWNSLPFYSKAGIVLDLIWSAIRGRSYRQQRQERAAQELADAIEGLVCAAESKGCNKEVARQTVHRFFAERGDGDLLPSATNRSS